MFKGVSSVYLAMKGKRKREDSESSINEKEHNTSTSNLQQRSPEVTSSQTRIGHGFTPAKLSDCQSSPIPIKANRDRTRTTLSTSSGSSSHFGSRSKSHSGTPNSIWEQAYMYGCR